MVRQERIEEAEATDRQLRRALGFFEIMFLVLGAIIGSGWLFGSFYASAMAGPASILSWIIAGVLLLFVALAFAELSGAIPKSGAIVRYPHYSHGSFTSTLLGWAYLLSAMTVAPAEAEAAVTYLQSWWPSTWPPLLTVTGLLTGVGFGIAFAFLTVFFLLNWFGVKIFGAISHGAGWWKLLIPSITVALILALIFHPHNFSVVYTAPAGVSWPSAKGFVAYGWAPVFFALPTTGIVFAYLGFRQGLDFGGETKNPQRDVPLGTITGFIIAIILYVLLQASFIGGINWSKLLLNVTTGNGWKLVPVAAGNWTALKASLVNTSSTYFNTSNLALDAKYLKPFSAGPFYELVLMSGIGLLVGWAIILLIDAVVSPSGTGWIYEGTTSRTLYGLAADGILPEWFLRLNKYKIPWIALITSWLVGALFMLPYPAWVLIVGFISLTTVLTYIIGGSALVVLRKTAPNMPRPFRLGNNAAAWVIGTIAFIAAYLIVYWSTFSVYWLASVFILIGVSLYYMMVAPSRFGVNRSHGIIAGIVYWIILGLSTWLLAYPVGKYLLASKTAPLTATNVALLVGFVIVNIAAIVGLTEWLKREMNEEGRAHTNAGYWVIAVIFTAYILTFLGQYGPFSTPIIPFPWDTVAAILVGLALFFYSVYSGVFTRDLEVVLRNLGVQPIMRPVGSPATPAPSGAPEAGGQGPVAQSGVQGKSKVQG